MGKRERLLCLVWLSGVSWFFGGSSSRCHGFVCSLLLWHFLTILTYYSWLDRYSHCGFCNYSKFCCALLYVNFSFAITLTGKRELVVLLSLSSLCLVIVA